LPNWFRKKKKDTFIDEPMEKQLRAEGAFSAIKGTEYTKLRVRDVDNTVIDIINMKVDQYNRLKNKKKLTVQDEELLNQLVDEIPLWRLYLMWIKAHSPWATGAEDRGSSERACALEKLFYRNIDNPVAYPMLRMALSYNCNISWKEWHVAPAPTVIIHNPQGQGGSINLAAADTKTEEVSD
jgi:hypothetical protein